MNEKYNYTPLSKPTPISEQQWPEGTLPIVATSTLTFNHVNFIHECIDGILMQETTFPVRIVIFNDCSNDGTTEIVKEYEKKYPDLFFVTHAPVNTWGKPERQEALKPYLEARGIAKYIAMCEGDDYWTDPLKLQKQVDFLEENEDYVFSIHKVIFVKGDSEIIYSIPKNDSPSGEYKTEDLLKNYDIQTCSFVFRNLPKLVSEVNQLSKDLYFGDKPLAYYLGSKGKIYYINNVMGMYRRHLGSVTNQKIKSKVEKLDYNIRSSEQNILLLNRFDEMTTREYYKIIQARKATLMMDLADQYHVKKEYRKTKEILRKLLTEHTKYTAKNLKLFFILSLKSTFNL